MSSRRWIVRAEDEATDIDAIVVNIGAFARGAISEGRAFVNDVRASHGTPVAIGDVVEVWSSRGERDASPTSEASLEPVILAQREEVLLAFKPAALPTEPEKHGDDALVTRLAVILNTKKVHAVSRLDVGVSGVVTCVTGARGAALLARAREEGRYRRIYVAILGGRVEGRGAWDDSIQGRRASTQFRALGHAKDATWIEIELDTGRTHQIRLHASAAGAPIIGDRAHGGRTRITSSTGSVMGARRPLLHAIAARIEYPEGEGPPLEATSRTPGDMRATWAALDGRAPVWEEWHPPWSQEPPAPPAS